MNDEISRRRFLALAAASAALASATSCGRSIDRDKVVPYTRKAVGITQGVTACYASALQEGEVAYGVLVRTREGRPILVEGNDADVRHRGKVGARAIADLLGLYDPDRLKAPTSAGRSVSWKDAIGELARAVGQKRVLLVTPAVVSPSRRALIGKLSKAVPDLVHVQWEPATDHVARKVAKDVYGTPVTPVWHFDRADVTLSLGADFLGTLGDATAATRDFARSKQSGERRLYVIESAVSLTGSNADLRLAVRPSALGAIGFAIARALVKRGCKLPDGFPERALERFDPGPVAASCGLDATALLKMARDLDRAGPRALVVAGPAAPASAHAAAQLINAMLFSRGGTFDLLPSPVLASPTDFDAVTAGGVFGAAIFWDVNPAYDLPNAQALRAALGSVPCRVRIGTQPDETTDLCSLVLPSHHWLESWGDFEAPGSEALLLAQPTTSPLYDTRQAEDILLALLAALGSPGPRTYREFVEERWQREVYPPASPVPFERFFAACLHDGALPHRATEPELHFDSAAIAAMAGETAATTGFEITLDTDAKIFDGRYANNGWLQELPDPVKKTCWGNPLSMSPEDAARLDVSNGDVVEVAVAGARVSAPVLVQQGQAPGVLQLSLGYGRRTGSVANGIGASAWPLAAGGFVHPVDSIVKTGRSEPLARSQDHFSTGGRDIARIMTVEEHRANGKRPHAEPLPSLYPQDRPSGPRWGMTIDLAACTGCGACVVACQSENNVPIVGPEQVRKGRGMHWIRIDRYVDGPSRVVHVPMLCQQCGNAPCENVCPVQATNHSADGLNQMAYNRCVGTRYCGNNCPYKVRRFNFLDFTGDVRRPLELARNPEVTVRPRGVMEKCTFCVQRIRNAEQVAKGEGRPLADREIQPACAVACPARAIVLGNVNDPLSDVRMDDARGFRVLEDLGTRPSVTYLAALRNPPGGGDER